MSYAAILVTVKSSRPARTRKPLAKPNQLHCFAVTAPGLEALCAAELAALGVEGRVVEGGVEWTGDAVSMMRANLWLRTASRVLVRVAEFRAKAFFELELNAKKIEWARYVLPGGSVEFRVTCRKSKLYHSGAVAQRMEQAVMNAVRDVRATRATSDDDASDESASDAKSGKVKAAAAEAPPQLFVVRFLHDVATVSVDTSGVALHRRGYRQQLAKAPLRETLAAATLLGAGWTGTTPFTDPMCGSGTIPIEAAMIARRMAPGRNRSFAFTHWPKFDRGAWSTLLDEAKAAEIDRSPVRIEGFDRDAGAIEASIANAERAAVAADITFAEQSVSALSPAGPPGLVASNPPYGVRVGETEGLRNLYAQLGKVLRARRSGWSIALLSADRKLERQMEIDFTDRLATKNGGIPVRLVFGEG